MLNVQFHMLPDNAKKILMAQDAYIDLMESKGVSPTLYLDKKQHKTLVDAIKSSAKAHKLPESDPAAFKYRGCPVRYVAQ